MAATLPLLRGSISLSAALAEEDDMCHRLSLVAKRASFFAMLSDAAPEIESVVATHLALPCGNCRMMTNQKTWVHGSYNVCVPVVVHRSEQEEKRIVLIRFPQPYKIGEETQPGNADEKLRTEAATYIWMQENCPTVPVPRLLGFGLMSGTSFTPLETTSVFARIAWHLRAAATWFLGQQLPCSYVSFRRTNLLKTGYLLLEFVEQGKQLRFKPKSEWEDRQRRSNLFHDLSKIMLSLARTPLPCIGSWSIDDRGVLNLMNRPVTSVIQEVENEGTPSGIPRQRTYTSADSYYLDILGYHDSRMRFRPNAILHQFDGEEQLAMLTCLRAFLRHFTQGCRGPFFMQFTDLHPSNIFVDEDWHITSMIDLEWICARPLEMLRAPIWLTDRTVDTLLNEHLDAYEVMLKEFMDAFAATESSMGAPNTPVAALMKTSWATGAHWYFNALDAPGCVHAIFLHHIQNLFLPVIDRYGGLFRVISSLWTPNAAQFIGARIAEKEDYQKRLKAMFAREDCG